jgi:hypothetical protein
VSRPSLAQLLCAINQARLLVLPTVQPGWGLFKRWAEQCGTSVLTWYEVAETKAEEMLAAAKSAIQKELNLVPGQERRLSMIVPDGPAPFEPAMMSEAVLDWLAINKNSPRLIPEPENADVFNKLWHKLIIGNIAGN